MQRGSKKRGKRKKSLPPHHHLLLHILPLLWNLLCLFFPLPSARYMDLLILVGLCLPMQRGSKKKGKKRKRKKKKKTASVVARLTTKRLTMGSNMYKKMNKKRVGMEIKIYTNQFMFVIKTVYYHCFLLCLCFLYAWCCCCCFPSFACFFFCVCLSYRGYSS
jgi:hypothetical protein